MGTIGHSWLTWAIRGLLAGLIATNLWYLALLRSGGPLVGVIFYGALLVLSFRPRQRHERAPMIGGAVGLAIHVAEVALAGWSAYPVLMVLNLVLAAGLLAMAWVAVRRSTRGSE